MNVLVFTRTTGFRHDSIPAGVAAFQELARANGFTVTATEDPAVFTPDGLGEHRVVAFVNTSGDVLDPPHRAALAAHLSQGNGYVGVHCAAHTETGWPFYADLVGASFTGHPPVQPALIRVEDRAHPATAHLAGEWARTDEWYDFAASPRGSVRVLLSVDEASYTGASMGDHPIAWCHERLGFPAFYTALGHTIESYHEPALRAHLLGAITWAALS